MAHFIFRIHHQSYRFNFKTGMLIFSAFFIMLFSLLGTWQWHRYHFKQALQKEYAAGLSAKPALFPEETGKLVPYQAVKVKGKYRPDLTLYLQNQFYKGQEGFEVLTPFELKGSYPLLLVDRGFIAKKQLQTVMAEKARDLGVEDISGQIKFLNEYQFILGPVVLTEQEPILLQKIDIAAVSRVSKKTFYPFILRLSPNEPHGFIKNFVVTTILPQRHLGYAVQWFLMAIALFVMTLVFCLEKVRSEEE